MSVQDAKGVEHVLLEGLSALWEAVRGLHMDGWAVIVGALGVLVALATLAYMMAGGRRERANLAGRISMSTRATSWGPGPVRILRVKITNRTDVYLYDLKVVARRGKKSLDHYPCAHAEIPVAPGASYELIMVVAGPRHDYKVVAEARVANDWWVLNEHGPASPRRSRDASPRCHYADWCIPVELGDEVGKAMVDGWIVGDPGNQLHPDSNERPTLYLLDSPQQEDIRDIVTAVSMHYDTHSHAPPWKPRLDPELSEMNLLYRARVQTLKVTLPNG